MSRRARNLRIIQLRWVARFGEPPAILTDPKLMLSILNDTDDRRASPGGDPGARALVADPPRTSKP